jgi:hypothetical protein
LSSPETLIGDTYRTLNNFFLCIFKHVQSLFVSWSHVLKKCHFIFYRAASSNQTIMFGGKNPFFDRGDPRLRSIPFPTRRATLNEVQRVWLHLATVELIGKITFFLTFF